MSECFLLIHVVYYADLTPLSNLSYRTTLNQREKMDDAEERSRLLASCHLRCAQRTLKVLEKNGGIFIKLGQHLVREGDPGEPYAAPYR